MLMHSMKTCALYFQTIPHVPSEYQFAFQYVGAKAENFITRNFEVES